MFFFFHNNNNHATKTLFVSVHFWKLRSDLGATAYKVVVMLYFVVIVWLWKPHFHASIDRNFDHTERGDSMYRQLKKLCETQSLLKSGKINRPEKCFVTWQWLSPKRSLYELLSEISVTHSYGHVFLVGFNAQSSAHFRPTNYGRESISKLKSILIDICVLFVRALLVSRFDDWRHLTSTQQSNLWQRN